MLTKGGVNSKPAKYGEDVLGTGDQADKFEDNYRLAFETFLHLSDNHPAAITEGVPDVICGGCAIGEHCRKLSNNDYHEFESTFKADGKYIDLFLQTLGLLNLPKPIIADEQTSFPDAEPQKTRRVKTTIGVVRTALKEEGLYRHPSLIPK